MRALPEKINCSASGLVCGFSLSVSGAPDGAEEASAGFFTELQRERADWALALACPETGWLTHRAAALEIELLFRPGPGDGDKSLKAYGIGFFGTCWVGCGARSPLVEKMGRVVGSNRLAKPRNQNAPCGGTS